MSVTNTGGESGLAGVIRVDAVLACAVVDVRAT
jgi:hypothetical protein